MTRYACQTGHERPTAGLPSFSPIAGKTEWITTNEIGIPLRLKRDVRQAASGG